MTGPIGARRSAVLYDGDEHAESYDVTHQRRRDDFRVRTRQSGARRGGRQWDEYEKSRTSGTRADAYSQPSVPANALANGRGRTASTGDLSTHGR